VTDEEAVIRETAWRLLSAELSPGRAFRLLGVGVSGFVESGAGLERQLPLPLG